MADLIITVILFAVGCGVLDRFRGIDSAVPAAVTKLLYGFWVGAFIAFNTGEGQLVGLMAMCLFAVGSAPGWGTPIGSALTKVPMSDPFEKWQTFPILKTNTLAALATRGLIWTGSLALLVAAPAHSWLWFVPALAMPIAFTAAPYIARATVEMPKRWATMEVIRGCLFGLIVGAATLV